MSVCLVYVCSLRPLSLRARPLTTQVWDGPRQDAHLSSEALGVSIPEFVMLRMCCYMVIRYALPDTRFTVWISMLNSERLAHPRVYATLGTQLLTCRDLDVLYSCGVVYGRLSHSRYSMPSMMEVHTLKMFK